MCQLKRRRAENNKRHRLPGKTKTVFPVPQWCISEMLNFEIPTWVGDNIIMLAIYITGKTLIAKYSEEENFYEQFTKKKPNNHNSIFWV